MSGRVRIGTSGWSYDHWRGAFYPKGIAKSRWLDYYAEHFSTVEVNYSFYRLPSKKTMSGWRTRVPSGFRFSMKGSRLITHVLKLSDSEAETRTFLERVNRLGSSLGVVLWQLPPDLALDLERLEQFLSVLPGRFRYAVEFRHPSWHCPEVYELLRDHGASLVSVSSEQMPRDFTVTSDFVYTRFHGLKGGYAHDYSRGELEPWAYFLRGAASDGKECFIYFNNDAEARAPKNAHDLADLLAE